MTPIRSYLAALHARLAEDEWGTVADYIPELALADRSWFGIALATVDGAVYEVGGHAPRRSRSSRSPSR